MVPISTQSLVLDWDSEGSGGGNCKPLDREEEINEKTKIGNYTVNQNIKIQENTSNGSQQIKSTFTTEHKFVCVKLHL